MRREKEIPQQVTEDDGPFSYSYISVMGVPGLNLNETEGDLHLFSFPELNATAFLTRDWDRHCHHIDRGSAVALLMYTGFRGRPRFKRLSVWLNRLIGKLFGKGKVFNRNLVREERNVQNTRHKEHTSSGCYLVYRAEGELIELPQLKYTTRFGCIGFGIDIVDGKSYRAMHSSALHSVAAALSLIIDKGTGSPEINKIVDTIYLKGAHDLVIYPKRFEMGSVSLTTSATPNQDELSEVKQYIPLIAEDNRIESAISLFIQSHRKDGDNLRAFIPAWSALELLIDRLTKIVQADWQKQVQDSNLPPWDKNLTGLALRKYGLRDRFYSVACVLDLENAEEDCEKFTQAYKLRNGYYHENEGSEKDLPTHEVRSLFRKYLQLALHFRSSH